MSTDIYRNLHKACWSVRPSGGHVSHADALVIQAPTFVIQKAGQARVRREKKKHVHAYVRTKHSLHTRDESVVLSDRWVRLTYNPYIHDTFIEAETGRYVQAASAAVLTSEGKLWAIGLVYLTGDTTSDRVAS